MPGGIVGCPEVNGLKRHLASLITTVIFAFVLKAIWNKVIFIVWTNSRGGVSFWSWQWGTSRLKASLSAS